MRSLEASQNAGSVALMLTVGLLHRSLLTRGFTMKRLLSTDVVVMLLLFFVVNLWAYLTSELIRIPWIALLFSWFWLLTYCMTLFASQPFHMWEMNCANGPFDWRLSVTRYWLYLLYALLILIQVPCGIALISQGDQVQGILCLASLGLFLSSGLPRNKYIAAAHRHSGDLLRIALPTSHLEGTVYVLPSRGYGFETTWSPKLQAEHLQTDSEIMELFAMMRTGSYSLSEPLRRLRTTMSTFNEGAILTDLQVNDLAEWLLMDPSSAIGEQPIKAQRPPNVHLIGRDLMFALAHAEYLIFMRKAVLTPRLREQLSRLRHAKRSGGLDGGDSLPTVGFKEGLEGYQEAVRFVYGLINMPMDPSAFAPPPMPTHYSIALGRNTKSTEDYVGSLWTLCLEHSESTFSALYMFCCVWFIEVGNVGGFHIFPLRCASQQGDPATWQVIWRQGWYECMVAQLIASSPLLAMAFIVGLF